MTTFFNAEVADPENDLIQAEFSEASQHKGLIYLDPVLESNNTSISMSIDLNEIQYP